MSSSSIPTLKSTCLNVIVSKFETFSTALDSTNFRSEKYFLQMFSDMLFEKLQGRLTKKHASFLINRYLKKLDFDRFIIDDVDAITEILHRQGETILPASTHSVPVMVSCHKCLQCGKTFVQKQNLTRHVRSVHDKVNSFPCEKCGKSFTRKCDVKRHMKIHQRGEPAPKRVRVEVDPHESWLLQGPQLD